MLKIHFDETAKHIQDLNTIPGWKKVFYQRSITNIVL